MRATRERELHCCNSCLSSFTIDIYSPKVAARNWLLKTRAAQTIHWSTHDRHIHSVFGRHANDWRRWIPKRRPNSSWVWWWNAAYIVVTELRCASIQIFTKCKYHILCYCMQIVNGGMTSTSILSLGSFNGFPRMKRDDLLLPSLVVLWLFV